MTRQTSGAPSLASASSPPDVAGHCWSLASSRTPHLACARRRPPAAAPVPLKLDPATAGYADAHGLAPNFHYKHPVALVQRAHDCRVRRLAIAHLCSVETDCRPAKADLRRARSFLPTSGGGRGKVTCTEADSASLLVPAVAFLLSPALRPFAANSCHTGAGPRALQQPTWQKQNLPRHGET